eukprot:294697-Rhodomonas_salina.1
MERAVSQSKWDAMASCSGAVEKFSGAMDSFFPNGSSPEARVRQEEGVQKAADDKLVEANKSNVILLSWLVVATLSVWLKSDAGDMILSIAAGVVGLAFSQNQKVLESFSASDEKLGTEHGVGHTILVLYCPVLSVIGGLIFGNTASKDGLGLAPALTVTILAGLLVLLILYTMWNTRRVPPEQEGTTGLTSASHKKTKPKEQDEKDTKTKEEDLLTWLSVLLLALSLTCAITGTVLTSQDVPAVANLTTQDVPREIEDGDIDIRRRLAFLGVSVGFGLLTSVLCKIMDEKANGGASIEICNIFLGVTVDIIPLAIELTLDENQNNPRVMTIGAWVSFASAAIFFGLVKFSLVSERGGLAKGKKAIAAAKAAAAAANTANKPKAEEDAKNGQKPNPENE